MNKVEYRVRPITRYIVTRYESTGNEGRSIQRGTFDTEETAYHVAYALCRKEHDDSGEPLDSMAFIYPAPIGGENFVAGSRINDL